MTGDYFSAQAAVYAAARPRYPAALFDALAARAPNHRLAWDCGTGNGQAAVALGNHFEQVHATDVSAAQLARASPHPRVTYRCAPADASGLADGAVALVTVAQAVHWFDLSRFYAEVRRVASPGAVCAVWGYGLLTVGEGVDDVVERYYRDVVGPYWPPGRELVEARYRTLPFPFPEFELPAFVMERQFSLHGLLAFVTSWSATQRYVRARGEDPVPALGDALRSIWGDPEAVRCAHWTLHVRAGIARPGE